MKINKIYNESNIETCKRLPNDFIDLVVTSPPYDNLRDYEGKSKFNISKIKRQVDNGEESLF